MSEAHGLSEKTVAQIVGVLARFPAVEKVVIFGSRAKGVHKPGSDIDLALHGPGLDWRLVGRIEDALDDLLLPYGFSLFICDERLDPALTDQVARFGKLFYQRPATGEKTRHRVNEGG